MPLSTIHLFSLASPNQLISLVQYIKGSEAKPLTLSRPVRWIIKPEKIQVPILLHTRWDLLVIIEDTKESQDMIQSLLKASTSFIIKEHWTSGRAGIPSRQTKDFLTQTNPSLLHPQASSVPPLTGALNSPILKNSSQDLSFSPELRSWLGSSESSLPIKGAVSMFNLLSFNPEMKPSYQQYGQAFAKTIGSKRGGNAKLVGQLIDVKEETQGVWHEFALAHYPSLLHFADMLASQDYQEVNQKYRVGALADTCILCTSELEIEDLLKKEGVKELAKL